MIILLGAPGSGKGTQTDILAKRLQINTVCMGDIVRNHITLGTNLGTKMKSYLDRGDLVPDEIINEMFAENKPALKKPFGAILDGFPRTIDQAKFLSSLYSDSNINVQVISLEVNDDILIQRLLDRNRSDDSIDVIKNRLITYKREIDPLLTYYQDNLSIINGDSSVDDVFNRIYSALKNNT